MSERLFLLLSDDDFLTGLVIRQIVAHQSARVVKDVPVTRVRAGEVSEPELVELLSPSLFAEDRTVVVEAADAAGKELASRTKPGP